MKILFVCHRLPYPPKRGGKIRPFNIIKHFHEQGHDVTVATLARSKGELIEGEGLRDFCTSRLVERVFVTTAVLRMIVRLASMTPSSMGYFFSPKLVRRINRSLQAEHYNLIFVHCSSVAPYVANASVPVKIFDLGDVDSQKWLTYSKILHFPKSLGYWLEGRKLQRAEIRLAEKFDLCTCTTRVELDTFDSFGTGVASGWFPNGVDIEYFSPATEPYDPDLICFVGRMDYFPNQQAMLKFCSVLFPLIRAERPAVKLIIVGASPSKSIIRLGQQPGIIVTGSVPDVRPWVRKAVLTVAPLLIARGTQNKILESMAMGVPVVASHEAAGGIDAIPGEHFLAASTNTEYKECILRLLGNPAERASFSVSGRQRVLSNHTWDRSMASLDKLIETHFAGMSGKTRQNSAVNGA